MAHAPPPVAAVELTEEKLLALVVDLDERHAAHALDAARLESPFQRMQCVILARDALLFVYLFHSLQRGVEGAAMGCQIFPSLTDTLPLAPARPAPADGCSPAGEDWPPEVCPYWEYARDPSRGRRRLCFMRRLHAFFGVCANFGVPLEGPEYLCFRPSATNNRGVFASHPLSSSASLARLKQALARADIDEGETLHSCRRGGIGHEKRKGIPVHETMERANIKTPKV